MSRRRRSYEAGHRAKYLVVVDDTPECDRAMYYASRRAARVGVSVVLLRVIETRDHGQQWLGVADIMRAEAHEEAEAMLETFAARSNAVAGITPEWVIREGEIAEQIFNLIEEDEDISVLVLAAGTGTEGPGPLVSHLGTAASAFPIPVVVVPGHLTDEELDTMT
jgi:nucleotide-binding universal stress UspA family protein